MRDRYASLREGLVGAWIPSVSGSGLLLPDLSGQGNNGTLTNMGPEDWVAGQYGRALDFDGTDDYVDLGYNPNIDFAGAISISCWLKSTSSGLNGIYTNGLSSSFKGCALELGITDGGLGSAGKIGLWNGTNWIGSISAVNSGNWIHICVTNDTSSTRFYIDSLLDRTAAQLGVSSQVSIKRSQKIAARENPSTFFNGQLDDIRIYNRALSESEIKLLASRPGIGLKPQRRTMYYAPPTGARRRRILTSMP